jgi:hypothetical protein
MIKARWQRKTNLGDGIETMNPQAATQACLSAVRTWIHAFGPYCLLTLVGVLQYPGLLSPAAVIT